ncbi:MAG TPA: hypothetical protein ENN39_09135 [Desulfonatronum sp.]|nr:hypothetical protein [Desulfonatronum sp.]
MPGTIGGYGVELFFQCPVKQAGFWSGQWLVDDDLEVCLDQDKRKSLRGTVRVSCPLCGEEHVYAPDALACPLRAAGHDPVKPPNNKGGA